MLVKDAAAFAATEVLNKHWDERTFPVNPYLIAERLGVPVTVTRLKPGISGAIIMENGSPKIFVEESENFGRKMFTVAHEIGHYIERKSHGDNDYSFVELRGGKYTPHEFYADEFAANLLMPEQQFRVQHNMGYSDVEIARFFAVNLSAVQVRKKRLKI